MLLKIQSSKWQPWKNYLLLFAGILAVYGMLLSMQVMPLHDFANYFFPFRFFVTSTVSDGDLPLWNPYVLGGIPVHADPQSGAWYPPVLLHGLIFGNYTLYSALIEIFLTVFTAAFGFYKLCRFFSIHPYFAIAAGIMYASSGFFVGHIQHLSYLISGAFLPFIFYYFFKILKQGHWRDSLKLGVFSFFAFSGGYPAFLFIAIYILLFLLIKECIALKKWKEILNRLLNLGLSLFVFLCCSAVILYSMYLAFPYCTRGQGVALQDSLFNPFSLQSFVSFVLPFATIQYANQLATDVSMANGYFGLLMLGFLMASLLNFKFIKKNWQFYFIAVVCLLVSLGSALPLRQWLFEYVPLMDLFRFPSIFSLFFILFFLLVAIRYANGFYTEEFSAKNVWVVFILLALFVLVTSLYYRLAFLQGMIQGLLIGLLIFFSMLRKRKFFASFFFILAAADAIFSARMNLPFTGYNTTAAASTIQKEVDEIAHHREANNQPLKNISDAGSGISGLWRNMNIFKREVAPGGYSALMITAYDSLIGSACFEKITENKFYFLSKICRDTFSIDAYMPERMKLCPQEEPGQLSVSSIRSNEMVFTAKNAGDQILVVFQSALPYHSVKINDKPTTVFKVCNNFIGVRLANNSLTEIRISYDPPYIKLSFTITAVSLLVFFILSLSGLRSKQKDTPGFHQL